MFNKSSKRESRTKKLYTHKNVCPFPELIGKMFAYKGNPQYPQYFSEFTKDDLHFCRLYMLLWDYKEKVFVLCSAWHGYKGYFHHFKNKNLYTSSLYYPDNNFFNVDNYYTQEPIKLKNIKKQESVLNFIDKSMGYSCVDNLMYTHNSPVRC